MSLSLLGSKTKKNLFLWRDFYFGKLRRSLNTQAFSMGLQFLGKKGLEPLTLRLSSVYSNQLSYLPSLDTQPPLILYGEKKGSFLTRILYKIHKASIE